jgi:hypothetical protein
MEGLRMKVLAALLFAVLLPLTGCLSQENKAVDPLFWDFGAVKQGAVVSHDFEVKNNLGRPLTIRDVTTSCGCTASAAKKKVLAPGESTQISVEFNSSGYRGITSQFVYVTTDDPDNQIIKFTFKADVKVK